MPTITFLPSEKTVEVDSGTKILTAAVQSKIDFSYSCGAARCGTCLTNILKLDGKLSDFNKYELALLNELEHPLDGSVRLACKTMIIEGKVTISQPD